MKQHLLYILIALCGSASLKGENADSIRPLSLRDAIELAQLNSVEAAVARNELKTAYWQYRMHQADQLPEINFTGSLPAYSKKYTRYLNSDGIYTFLPQNSLEMTGAFNIEQNIALTGGKLSLSSAIEFNRHLGEGAFNEFLSLPIGLTLSQPIFGVNTQKWNRRIEPVRYREAKAAYIEQVETVTLTAIQYYFNLLLARSNLNIAEQNLKNSNKLYDIAQSRRAIGQLSENELMQLQLSALQAEAKMTDARSNLNAKLFKLRAFLGITETEPIEPFLPDALPDMSIHYPEVLEKANAYNAFAYNIRRRQLEADYEVASAKGKRREINLYASVGYSGKDQTFGTAYQHLRSDQIVEVGVSIPLLDWGKRKGKVRMAESNRDVVLSRIRQEEQSFEQDLFLLVENFNNQAQQLSIALRADQIAQKRYETTIASFLIGKINLLDLNDAQQSKDNARQKYIEELYLFWSYFYNIRSLTLYDFMLNRTIDADIESLIRK